MQLLVAEVAAQRWAPHTGTPGCTQMQVATLLQQGRIVLWSVLSDPCRPGLCRMRDAVPVIQRCVRPPERSLDVRVLNSERNRGQAETGARILECAERDIADHNRLDVTLVATHINVLAVRMLPRVQYGLSPWPGGV